MKKKISIVILTLILIFIGILFYSDNIKNLRFFENKKAINESEITTIDVTGIELGKETEHGHIYKTMYDDNKHWEECKICGEKANEVKHNYIDNGWTIGNSCSESNVHKYTCNCGSSYSITTGRKGHSIIGVNNTNEYSFYNYCKENCGYVTNRHYCRKSDGSRISCSNLGTCSICYYTYNNSNSFHSINKRYTNNSNEVLLCEHCNLYLGTLNYGRLIKISNTQYKIQECVTVPNGMNYSYIYEQNGFGSDISFSPLQTNINGTTWFLEHSFSINNYREWRWRS